MKSAPDVPSRSSTSLEIVPLGDEHLEDAAALFTDGYRVARQHEPLLPACHEDPGAILPKLRDLAQKEPGVVAVRDGRVAGFLLGQVYPMFRGKRSVYVPEWAHAADGKHRGDTHRAMYAALSPRWVANGCFLHVITILAHDSEAVDAHFRLGFGMTDVDAVRGLGPVEGARAQVHIRRAGPDDVDTVLALAQEVDRHLSAAPVFLAHVDRPERDAIEKTLANPKAAVWLARRRGKAVAYVHIELVNHSGAHVIGDEKTASMKGAFTKKDCRGSHIATALLNRAVEWARSAGSERCAVDFEPHNIPGARFWLRHFQPVCYSLARHVDERIAWTQKSQEKQEPC